MKTPLLRLVHARPIFTAASILVATALDPSSVGAQSGVQITPDGKRVLVSKDVGAERWALTRNLADGSVTGNVFTTEGGDPQFVACSESGRSEGNISLRCEAADRCHLTPCTRDEWLFIADVTLPEAFFEPGTQGAAAATTQSLARRSLARVAGVSERSAGVQTVPNGSASLVNKDVGGGQRWAITLNGDDDTVTGNVFFPNGDDPAFLWCETKSFDGEERLLNCLGADRCSSSCSPDDWQPVAEVTIAEEFFAAPDQITTETLDGALTASLGSTAAFDALILAFGQGYSLRQIADAALSGRLRSSGDIVDRMGQAVPPDEPPYRVEAGAPAGLGRTSNHLVHFDPESFRDTLEGIAPETDIRATAILFMLNRGYTARQILSAIEEGRIAARTNSTAAAYDSFVIVDDKDRPVTPLPIGGLDVLLPPELTAFECGNGIVDPGESCEAGVAIRQSCAEFGFDGGALGCVANLCRYDTRSCRKCGNQLVEPGEECDGNRSRRVHGESCRELGFETGALPSCTSECKLDDAPCHQAAEDGCPDGDLDPGEECDGASFRGGSTCALLGADLVGDLDCNRLTCKFDGGRCRSRSSGCGDGRLGDTEQCDGSSLHVSRCADFDRRYVSGTLACDEASCTYDTSDCEEEEPTGSCGDRRLDPGEQCDGDELRQTDCAAFDARFDGGSLGCRESDCTYDISDCRGCGDGILEDDENCEAGQLSGFTCEIFDLGPGTLRCDESCDFDTSGCGDPSDLCGNGITNPGEDCDGRVLAGITCSDIDDRFAGGTLACGDDCRYDTSACDEANVCDEATCPDGGCVPFGADCCGGGFFCQPGKICVGGPGGGCCPEELPKPCETVCVRAGAPCP